MHAFLHTIVLVGVLIVSSSIPADNHPCPESCAISPDGPCPDPKALEIRCGKIRGILTDACKCCHSCAKLEGETCHGAFGVLEGSCKEGLKCTVPIGIVEDGTLNITGICKPPKIEGERCGGAYGYLGQCHDGLECAVPYRKVDYDEIMKGINISGTCVLKSKCLRNCSLKPINHKCGSDGRWYRNLCALKKMNCFLRDEEEMLKRAPSNTCETACPEITVPEYARVALSNGVKAGSEATFSCDPGYVLSPTEARTLTCRSQQWQGTPPTCEIEISTATPSTEAGDAELFSQGS